MPQNKSIFVLPDEFLQYQICSQCKKYLSCGPVKSYVARGIYTVKCGRCVRDNDGGFVSQYNKLWESAYFPCVNRFEGCNHLIHFNETAIHEEKCLGSNTTCPICSPKDDTAEYSLLALIGHFKYEHWGSLNQPVFRVTMGDEKNYLHYDTNKNILVLINIIFKDESLLVKAFAPAANSVSHRIIIYNSNTQSGEAEIFRSNFMDCQHFSDTSQGFMVPKNFIGYTRTLHCKIECIRDHYKVYHIDCHKIDRVCKPTIPSSKVLKDTYVKQDLGESSSHKIKTVSHSAVPSTSKGFEATYVKEELEVSDSSLLTALPNDVNKNEDIKDSTKAPLMNFPEIHRDDLFKNHFGVDYLGSYVLSEDFTSITDLNSGYGVMITCNYCENFLATSGNIRNIYWCINCTFSICGQCYVYGVSTVCPNCGGRTIRQSDENSKHYQLYFYCKFNCKQYFRAWELLQHENLCRLNTHRSLSDEENIALYFGERKRANDAFYRHKSILYDRSKFSKDGVVYVVTRDNLKFKVKYEYKENIGGCQFAVLHNYKDVEVVTKICEDKSYREAKDEFYILNHVKSAFFVVIFRTI